MKNKRNEDRIYQQPSQEHRWLMPIMCLITSVFGATLAYVDLGLVQQLGLGSLVIGSILCARASMVMTHRTIISC